MVLIPIPIPSPSTSGEGEAPRGWIPAVGTAPLSSLHTGPRRQAASARIESPKPGDIFLPLLLRPPCR